MPNCLMILMTVLVGGMMMLRTGSNALLGYLLGRPLSANLASLDVGPGTVCLGLPPVRAPLPVSASLGGTSWWSWLSGLFGVAYLTVVVLVAPCLGAATFIACVVTGRMLVSALCNQLSWAGFPVCRLSQEGYLGLALMVTGVLLLQWRGEV